MRSFGRCDLMQSSLFALTAGMAGAALTVAGAPAPAAAEAPVQRLVIAVDPPAGDTNLFWGQSADVTLFPAMGRLVGNDPETGEYDDSGLAREWEANDDFTEWTFYLHEGIP
jgi:peptide/nickel transport system substrate-binding protein